MPQGASLGASPRVAWALCGAMLVGAAAVALGFGAGATVPMAMRATLNLVEPQRFIDATLGRAAPTAEVVPAGADAPTLSEAFP